jgi:prevent-host-death family protein
MEPDRSERITVTATEAQHEFDRILDIVEGGCEVVITRDNAPYAVLVPVESFDVLSGDASARPIADASLLETLTVGFDAMFENMQTPEAGAAADRVFDTPPEELARAAVEAARHHEE